MNNKLLQAISNVPPDIFRLKRFYKPRTKRRAKKISHKALRRFLKKQLKKQLKEVVYHDCY